MRIEGATPLFVIEFARLRQILGGLRMVAHLAEKSSSRGIIDPTRIERDQPADIRQRLLEFAQANPGLITGKQAIKIIGMSSQNNSGK